jgi:hypothetical protein
MALLIPNFLQNLWERVVDVYLGTCAYFPHGFISSLELITSFFHSLTPSGIGGPKSSPVDKRFAVRSERGDAKISIPARGHSRSSWAPRSRMRGQLEGWNCHQPDGRMDWSLTFCRNPPRPHRRSDSNSRRRSSSVERRTLYKDNNRCHRASDCVHAISVV